MTNNFQNFLTTIDSIANIAKNLDTIRIPYRLNYTVIIAQRLIKFMFINLLNLCDSIHTK